MLSCIEKFFDTHLWFPHIFGKFSIVEYWALKRKFPSPSHWSVSAMTWRLDLTRTAKQSPLPNWGELPVLRTDPLHSSVQLFFYSETRTSCSSCKSQLPEAWYLPIPAKCPRSCNCLRPNEFVSSLFLIGGNFCFPADVIYSMFEQTTWFVLRVNRFFLSDSFYLFSL